MRWGWVGGDKDACFVGLTPVALFHNAGGRRRWAGGRRSWGRGVADALLGQHPGLGVLREVPHQRAVERAAGLV